MKTKIEIATILILLTIFTGCKSVQIDSTKVLDPQDKVAFIANEPKGAMVHVTIDLKSIVFKNPEEKARMNLPDLSELSVIKGWFLYNVEAYEESNDAINADEGQLDGEIETE